MNKNKRFSQAIASFLMIAIIFTVFIPTHASAAGITPGTPYSIDSTYDVSVPHVIINQVYGGYNPSKDIMTNTTTYAITYKDKGQACTNSFIELYNPTSQDVNLSAWSIQYSTSPYYITNQPVDVQDGKWAVLPLTGTIKAHSSYLIRCAATGSTAVNASFGLNILGVAADQDWTMPINTKGFTVALISNQIQLTANKNPFDNTTKKPTVPGYVDMIATNGNDGTTTSPTNEIVFAYEGTVTNSQSKQKAIRRAAFADTDNNAAYDDASGDQLCDTQVIGYNTSDAGLLNWAKPRCTADGAWSASAQPNPTETTSLSATAINCLTNSFGTDPKTTRTFTWEMPASFTTGQALLSTSSDMSNAKTYTATVSSSDNATANTFRVAANDLQAGAKYYYKVVSGSVNSSVYSFTTEKQTVTSFSFLHISDTQADVQTDTSAKNLDFSTFGNALGTVLNTYQPDFMLETGDLVDVQNSEDQWRWFFGAGQNAFNSIAFMPVIGNHEQNALYPSTAFREHFTVPNACTDPHVTPGTVYSFDYGAAHFVVLNSECKGAGFTAQHTWAALDMAKTKQKFIIVALHRGMYGGSGISDTFTAFSDLLDKYNVSLVLQGHDHAYIRTKPMYNGAPAADGTGTISLETGGSGAKQDNAPTLQSYMDVVAKPGLPTFSVITVTDSQISVHSVSVENATNPTVSNPATLVDLQAVATGINPSNSSIDFTINAPAAQHGSLSDVIDSLISNTSDTVVTADANSGDTVKSDIMSKLKESKKTAAFSVKDGSGHELYRWIIDGATITDPTINLDLGISFTSPQKSAIDQLAGDTNSLYLSFNHVGALPGPAQIKVYVGNQYSDGSIINLYYYNPKTGKAELVASGLEVLDGYVQFTITHCSDYFLTTKKISDVSAAPTTSTTNVVSAASTALTSNPGTGDHGNSALYIVLAFAGLVAVSILILRTRKGKVSK